MSVTPGAGPSEPPDSGPIVLLAGPGDATNIVYHYLERALGAITLVQEEAPSRTTLARRRVRRLGWTTVFGQVAFVVVAMPLLRWRARHRIDDILSRAELDPSPVVGGHRVASVNSVETVSLLGTLRPSVVVVHGTRIISARVLAALRCPIVNLHAGITPRYRGVHGGYWALAEHRADLAGTTIHVVDEGIDTGPVLARGTFSSTTADSIATYQYLQLECGLPLLVEQVRRILTDGVTPRRGPAPTPGDAESRLWSHPTLWGYAWRRLTQKVR